MAAGTWTLVNGARTDILNGNMLSSGSFKVALYLNTSNLTTASTTYAGVTNEVGTSNTGYTTGGIAITPALSGTTSVTWSFTTNPQWTAGSSNLTAKWAAIYKTTSTANIFLFCTLDSGGADVTATNGNTLTIDSDGTPNPVFTLA